MPVGLLFVSHADLVVNQKVDPSLKELFDSMWVSEVGGVPSYFLHNGLLMRRWMPCVSGLDDRPVEQIVWP